VTLPPIAEAIEYAYASGCVFVAAAGNSYCDVSYVFPANHPLSIAAAAIDWESRKPAFSCFGTDVDVAAPGVNVLSLYATNSPMGKSSSSGKILLRERDFHGVSSRGRGCCPDRGEASRYYE